MRSKVRIGPADNSVMCSQLGSFRWNRAVLLRMLAVLAILWSAGRTGSAQSELIRRPEGGVDESGLSAPGVSRGAGAGRSAAAARFLRGRTSTGGVGGAESLGQARAAHASMVQAQSVQPKLSTLNASWQALGPGQVASQAYGKISGRISSIAIDPADGTGNTVYLGTAGGGVWKSTNAAGPTESVSFAPLTDNLPVFSGGAGSSATTSLSIGAVSARAGGVVLAGTGDPNDASDSYYGGGILRSGDGGLTWTLNAGSEDGASGLHSFVGLGFAGFAWSTVNPDLVVAAVSQSVEGVIVNAPTSSSVMGLYVSSDAGVTWHMATILDGTQTLQMPLPAGLNGGGVAATSVVWNSIRQRFYAAVRYHGYYESADGVSWTRLSNQPGTAMTMTACPTGAGAIGSSTCPVFRGTLAVQPTTGDMFALTADRNNVDQGLWQDVCGIAQGTCSSGVVSFSKRLVSGALEVGNGSTAIAQADYNLSLAAVPSGTDTLLFIGTTDLYRCSLAAGCVLRNTTNATNGCGAPARVAPAQHAIAPVASSTLLYLGNDSGLWRSTDDVAEQGSPCASDDVSHFQNLNGGVGSLAEVVSFAQDPVDPAILLVGMGASGTASTAADASSAWPQVSAGEGGDVAINQNNPLLWYISTAGGVSVRQCSSGSRCGAADFAGTPTIGATQTSSDASVIDPPWLLDPGLSGNLIVGTCRVWRGDAGSAAAWSNANRLSAIFGGPQNSKCDPTTNPFLRSLAAGGISVSAGTPQNSGSRVMYAGMAGGTDGGGAFRGRVFATMSGDTASGSTRWADLSTSSVTNDFANAGQFNPGGFDISSLAVDPHDSTGKTVYATVMGFSGGGISAPHLYGSTDGGAHWLNISSNLPNAPANSVVVDPNDANTLYVAMDTGVYVTTQVASCTTANCWSVYGLSLPNAPVVRLLAAERMLNGDGRIGVLRAGTYGRGIWQLPLLTAAYPAQPAMALSATSLLFADQAIGSLSGAQSVRVTNTGSAPLLVSRSAVTGNFTVADSCAGLSIPVNGSCTIEVQFLPTAQGTREGLLTIYGNVSGGQAAVSLAGQGTPQGDILLTPAALTFPTTMMSATSAAQSVTISNVGGSPVTIGAPAVSGDFQMTANTCGSSLAPGTGCTVSIAFAPGMGGTRNGSFTVTGSSGTQTALLTGVATVPATDAISTVSLNFGIQQLGATSLSQQVILTNAGDVPLSLISAQIGAGDFAAVNGCGSSLNAHSTCSIAVAYVPKTVGTGAGLLVVSDQFRSQTVTLMGTGAAPPGVSLSPAGYLPFPPVVVGGRSVAQPVTLTNNGGLPLTIGSVLTTGDFALAAGGSCGAVLEPSAACTIQVVFTPLGAGTRSGSLAITDNAPNSPHTLTLSGTGIDFSLAADGSTSATVANGKSATYPLLLSSAATLNGSATLTCTGAPVNATCTVSPGAAPLGSTTLVTVTVATGLGSSAIAQKDLPDGTHRTPPILFAGMLPLGLLAWRRGRKARIAGLLAILCVAVGGGCGSGRAIPVTGVPNPVGGVVTPAGTYTLTVAATSSGLTRTMNLSLTVQ